MIDGRKIIVSLTTIPSRMTHIYPCLLCITKQVVKADEIVLVLPKESKREPKPDGSDPYEMPKNLYDFIQKEKITIYRPEKDWGPATKLLPVLKREMDKKLPPEKENLIITMDDDKLYDKHTIESLVNCWKHNPNFVAGRKGGFMEFTKNKKNHPLYEQSKKFGFMCETPRRGADFTKPGLIHVIYGTGGVLYRPSFFDEGVFGYESNNAPKEAFFVDDVWISGQLAKRNVSSLIAPSPRNKYHEKTENIRCGMMDISTSANMVNRLFMINIKDDCKTNVVTMQYFRGEFLKLIRNQKKERVTGKIKKYDM